ncbi:MAG: ABC transporter ATP-binding protein [Desulfobacteraceae bacterium]
MLKTEELSFQYAGGTGWAIKDVCIEVNRGECVLLYGASGCGKSTLVKCLNGLVPHFEKGIRAGRVMLDQTDMADMPMHGISQRVGAVFQNPRSQFFTTHVIDEIAFGCENFGMPREQILSRIDESLDRFGIAHLRDRKIFDLSSGEQQKVIIASVYAMGADVWVMDEPSANLDNHAIDTLRDIIGSLKEEGKTIVIAEHRYHYLKEYIDRAVLLKKGRVCSVHSDDSFLSKKNHHYVSDEKKVEKEIKYSGRSLTAKNIFYDYPKSRDSILEGIDISVSGGEITAITGNNGSGKTTLAMIIAGLIRPDKGEINFNSSPVTSGQRIKKCRMVLQEADHQLFTETVYRELEIGIKKNGDHRDRIMKILKSLGLDHKARKRPHSLSGGEKQRLAVAAALAADPEILILDEPTSGLDAENMMRMGDILNHASRRGAVVIVITHDNEFIKNCCTRVLRIKKGGIINE